MNPLLPSNTNLRMSNSYNKVCVDDDRIGGVKCLKLCS